MATVNFSVPESVKKEFNDTFDGQNKSAVVANLMREAVERARHQRRSHDAIGRILERHERAPLLSENEIKAAREKGRL